MPVLATAPASTVCRDKSPLGIVCPSSTSVWRIRGRDEVPSQMLKPGHELFVVAASSQLNFHVHLKPKESVWIAEREHMLRECYRNVLHPAQLYVVPQKILRIPSVEILLLDSTS